MSTIKSLKRSRPNLSVIPDVMGTKQPQDGCGSDNGGRLSAVSRRFMAKIPSLHRKKWGQKQQKLCQRCKEIDLDGIFNRPRHLIDSEMVLDLGILDEESRCALCRFFCSMRRTTPDSETARSYDLRVYSFNRYFNSGSGCRGSTLWAIDPDRFMHDLRDNTPLLPWSWFIPQSSSSDYFEQRTPWSNKPTVKGLPVKETSINYPLLRAWIKECGNHPTCNYRSFDPSGSHNRTTIRGIDCTTRRIVDLQPGDAYITLSYVWGNKALPNNKADRALPNTVPKAVEDAMIVVQQLGQRYLWVDQYCIDQHDEQDKHAQIRNMDHIYEGSHATIVAFSGEDSSSGLPGVSSTPRIPQPRFTSSTVALLGFASVPALDSSVWMRRGWTFQEALLSRRLLLFAHDQVYFFCSSGVWVESSMPMPRMLCQTKHQSIWYSAIASTIIPLRRLRHSSYGCQIDISLDQLIDLIGSYNKRQLSFQADALNAFRGLLSRVPFITYWGLPCYELPRGTKQSKETYHSLALQASDKTAASLLLRFLCWEPESTCLGRREGFPSWSWLGWETSDGISAEHLDSGPAIAHSTLNIEDDDGTTISMFDLIRQLGPEIERSSVLPERTTYLWLEGPVFTLGFQPANPTYGYFRFCPNHPLGHFHNHYKKMKESCTQQPCEELGMDIRFRFDIKGSKELGEKALKRKWDCLLVFTSDFHGTPNRHHFLILDPAEEHAGAYYVVVGTLRLKDYYRTILEKVLKTQVSHEHRKIRLG
ncbi:HET-domain-containing protein [Copromyces sp. CBS 386.78]|nr:HET-domain-containing protein [Copromyces sp. CBS 386.78]